MIQLLAKRFIPDRGNTSDPAVRQAYGVLCGVVGIVLNILLFAGKVLAGLLSGSVAIAADAANNLSDAGSSLVTLLGFKLADQKPDADHPFGHGRMEYVSGLVVSMVIFLMGLELGKSAVEKILHPRAVSFDLVVGAILLASVGVKLYMALYNFRLGRQINSAAMRATGADSLSDAVATTAVFLSTLAGHLWGWTIDGWCGLLVTGFVLWAGYNAAKETISPLLGQSPDPEYVKAVEELVLSHGEIVGIHDLIVHDYGPGRRIISLHAEVPADGDIRLLHDVVDFVERELSETMGCVATIHMDPIDTNDVLTARTRERVAAIVRLIDPAISIHDFRMVSGPTHTNVIFDAVVPYNCVLADRDVAQRIQSGVRALDGNYFAVVRIEKGYV